MKTKKEKMIKLLGKIPQYVPDWSKRILRPFSGVYSKAYRGIYSSIKEEKLVRTPMGPYIYVRYWDCVERGCAIGTWETRYMDLFSSKLREGDVVVDVGAYVGVFSLVASKRVGGKGCVYAFEPVPRNYERLIRNIGVNKAENVKPYSFGLSDRNESLSLMVPTEVPAEASLAGSWTELTRGVKLSKDAVQAQLVAFDHFCEDEGLDRIDMIKIDVDGAELKVIKGMRNTLMKHEDVMLFLEVTPPLIDLLGGSVLELIELLIESGFKTLYSIELNSEINLPSLSRSDIITTFGDVSRNCIFYKGKGKCIL